MEKNNEETKEKLSVAFSLFIAVCIVGLFCAISIAISKNINNLSQEKQSHYFKLPNADKDGESRVLL